MASATAILLLALVATGLTTAVRRNSHVRAAHRAAAHRIEQATDSASRTAAILAVASQFAHDVTTYDYRTLHADFARVLANATGKFEQDFTSATADTGQFVRLVKSLHATASGEVLSTSIESQGETDAEVIAIVSQMVDNDNRPKPQFQRTEGRIDLVNLDGRWLVTDFHVL